MKYLTIDYEINGICILDDFLNESCTIFNSWYQGKLNAGLRLTSEIQNSVNRVTDLENNVKIVS